MRWRGLVGQRRNRYAYGATSATPDAGLLSVRACSADDYLEVIRRAGEVLPVEQSPDWARYEDSLPDREHWRYLVVGDGDLPVAAFSLTVIRGRVLEQLWAKHGPVWLDERRTAAREREVRAAVSSYIRRERPSCGLLRLHTTHLGSDLTEPLLGATCDRTVLLDIAKPEDQLLAEMSQNGRRNIRKALKNDLVFADETAVSRHEFHTVMYPVFEETGRRDGFVLRPAAAYYEMLWQLGPDICRFFTVRCRGKVVAWTMVTTYDDRACYYYAASTGEAANLYAAYRLVWGVLQTMQAEGVRTFDFCGAGSDRAPDLIPLNRFKLNFGRQALIEIPGPWDVVLRPHRVWAYHSKKALRAAAARAVATMRGALSGVAEVVPKSADQVE